jgi:glutaredoxin/glutathione-dependent peroxiredoxin
MTIQVGDTIPSMNVQLITDGPNEVSTGDIFGGKKIVLFGLPGAYTPTCSATHVPGFVNQYDDIKAKGADGIICLSVNDPAVLGAWSDDLGARGKVDMLADGSAELTKAMGLDIDLSVAGLSTRCKRFSMIVDDGKVTALNIEDSPPACDISSAASTLSQL